MTQWSGFCGPTFMRSQSLLASPEQCMNWYPQRNQDGRYALYPPPGLTSFVSSPESPGRGLISNGSRAFAVIGPTVYELFSDGTITSRGTVATGQYPASMAFNGDGGDELLIVSGDTGYILTLSTNVLTTDVSNVTQCGFIDGYFVALDINSSTMRISNLLDGTTWDATQIAQRSTAQDPWKGLLVKFPRIWLFGDHTSDIWFDQGTSPFPMAPIPGVQIPYGIAAPFSATTVGSSVMWLTRNRAGQGQVVESVGYTPRVVSTEPVEFAFRQFSRIDDAIAYSYQHDGHEFYVLNFPAGDQTWVYDKTEQLWHQLGSWNSTTGVFEEWGPQHHTHMFGKHLVLHSANGTIYELNPESYTDADGNVIRRVRVPMIWPNPSLQHRTYIDRLLVDVEPGLGLTTGQGSDPEIMMSFSKNGGKVFGPERSRKAGKAGKYETRVQWYRCGSGHRMVPKISVSDPIPWRVLGCDADVRQ
jgi:hypothetical protein